MHGIGVEMAEMLLLVKQAQIRDRCSRKQLIGNQPTRLSMTQARYGPKWSWRWWTLCGFCLPRQLPFSKRRLAPAPPSRHPAVHLAHRPASVARVSARRAHDSVQSGELPSYPCMCTHCRKLVDPKTLHQTLHQLDYCSLELRYRTTKAVTGIVPDTTLTMSPDYLNRTVLIPRQRIAVVVSLWRDHRTPSAGGTRRTGWGLLLDFRVSTCANEPDYWRLLAGAAFLLCVTTRHATTIVAPHAAGYRHSMYN
jgi:hypothetical protein